MRAALFIVVTLTGCSSLLGLDDAVVEEKAVAWAPPVVIIVDAAAPDAARD